jgi:glycosyltransferase involved in cell wall biosynthesis
LCNEFALKDSRIKVIHKKNAGVAAARNTGLDIAKGEYITFVDSDDYIEPSMYEFMMNVAREYDCDVVMCDCVKEFSDYREVYSHDIRGGFYNYEQLKREYYPHLLMMENVEYPATISNWLCLYRRDQQSGLRYVEGVRFSEDLLFGAQMMYQARSFYYMKNQVFYHYCMNSISATHTFAPDKWNDYMILHEKTEKYFLSEKEYDFRNQIDLMLLFFVYNAVGDCFSSHLPAEKKITLANNILSTDVVRKMFSRLYIPALPISWKLKIVTILYKYKIGLTYLANS